MSSTAICRKVGCNLPVYVEPRTQIAHGYCGRTHAMEAMGGNNVQQPHGSCHICNMRGCNQSVAFDAVTGRVHDFCCKEHADRAISSGEWIKPQRYTHYGRGKKEKVAGPTCRFPNCKIPVFNDPSTGRQHDYCGRSHAVEHRLMQSRVNHGPPATAHSAGQNTIYHTGYARAVPSIASAADSKPSVHKTASSGLVGFAVAAKTVEQSSHDDEDRKPAALTLPKCAICLGMNASIILIPCGHVCLCKDDAENLRRNQQLLHCPICRREVMSTNEVFLNH